MSLPQINYTVAIGITLLLFSIIFGVLILTGKIKVDMSSMIYNTTEGHTHTDRRLFQNLPVSTGKKDNESHINPMVFKTGNVFNTPQALASNCTDVLYPINMPNVNYGLPPINNDCGCLEFIQAP